MTVCRIIGLGILILGLWSCSEQQKEMMDIQGHRGARGNLPENTIEAMLFAIDAGVKTLELDLVISGDSQVVVSHEPWFSHLISITPEGNSIEADSQYQHNIFTMSYERVRQYDVGSKGNPNFPNQKATKAFKPLLRALIEEVEAHLAENQLKPVFYNIEIKSLPQGDERFHPIPDVFCQLVMQELDDLLPTDRYNIQSFDTRVLVWMHEHRPDVVVAYLIESIPEGQTLPSLIEALSFVPDIISPQYNLVDQQLIAQAAAWGSKVIPWTVNNKEAMQSLGDLGVDGIITDYPLMGVELFGSYQQR